MEQKPEHLTLVKSEPIGLMGATHYAVDPQGNVWHCVEKNGRQSEWRLYKKASEVPQPTLSFEQMVRLGQTKNGQNIT